MKTEDVVRMAKEAHHELVTKDYPGHLGQLDPWTMKLLERFAALVREQTLKEDKDLLTAYLVGFNAGKEEFKSIRAEALEEAAKVCECDDETKDYYLYAQECVTEIRGLK